MSADTNQTADVNQRLDVIVSNTDEVEVLSAAAGAESDAAAAADVAMTAGEGVTVRRAFAMKNFLPGTGYQEWINRNVVGKGVGTHVLVGRVYGMIYEQEPRATMFGQPGQQKEIKSIALSGDLEAESIAGEKTSFDMLFLPMAFATRVARALREGARHVEIDVDIGVLATGKAIPYEWTCTSYLNGRAERQLRAMANSRRIGGPSPLLKRLASETRGPVDIDAQAEPVATAALEGGGPAPEGSVPYAINDGKNSKQRRQQHTD